MESKNIPKKLFLKAEALSAVRRGETDTAIVKYLEYLKLNPGDFDAWARLGGAYRRKGLLDDAIHNYEKAYKINPQSTYALVNLISLLSARNRINDQSRLIKYLPVALQLLRQLIDNGNADFWTWYDLATLQLIQGDFENAKSTFSYAAELTPKTATENYKSVLSNLCFLRDHNPSIQKIDEIIHLINKYI